MKFKNRVDAGKKLALSLKKYASQKDAIVLAIPRGGVVVGAEVAKALKLPLDIVMTKKISVPENEEFAIGAVHLDGDVVLNEKLVKNYDISKEYIEKEAKKKLEHLKTQMKYFRNNKPPLDLKNKTIILVDDGIATGYTIISACKYLKEQKVKNIVIASPVAPPDVASNLKECAAEIIIDHCPNVFGAVGNFYEKLEEVTDDQVKKILKF